MYERVAKVVTLDLLLYISTIERAHSNVYHAAAYQRQKREHTLPTRWSRDRLVARCFRTAVVHIEWSQLIQCANARTWTLTASDLKAIITINRSHRLEWIQFQCNCIHVTHVCSTTEQRNVKDCLDPFKEIFPRLQCTCYYIKQIQNVRYVVSRDTSRWLWRKDRSRGRSPRDRFFATTPVCVSWYNMPDVLYLFSDIANLKYFKLIVQSEKMPKHKWTIFFYIHG